MYRLLIRKYCSILPFRIKSSNQVVNMSSYASEYPSGNFDPAYKAFFERFYQISDTPEAHEEYSKQFTSDADLIMASTRVKGTSGIFCVCTLYKEPSSNIGRNSGLPQGNVDKG